MKYKNITIAAVMTAFISVCSMLSINISGVAYSLALFGVVLSGLVLSPAYAFAANATYLLIGLVGIPVFANFNSGLTAILGQSGGFILSYPFVALIISAFIKKIGYSYLKAVIYSFLGLMICYFFGTVWYMYIYGIGIVEALIICVVPFVIVDIIKILICCYAAKIIRKQIKK